MLLCEAGYNQQDHDNLIASIKDDNLEHISDIIECVKHVYMQLYLLDDYHINCGMCEDFATDVIDCMGGETDCLRAEWNDGIIGCNPHAAHCVIIYKDKFYDSQHPEGSPHDECLKWDVWN